MRISEDAVDRPYVVLLTAGLLFVLGLNALSTLPLESDPSVKVPWVWVAVPYPGAAPEDVEDEITRELDEALHGLDDVDYINSVATQGASFHYIKFLDGVDGKVAVDDVRNKIDEVKSEFPDDAEEPRSDGISFDDKPILIASLTGDRDLFRLKDIAEDLQPILESVPGVRAVDIFGGLEREIRVEVDTERMAGYGLTFEDISRALKTQNVNFPGGRFDVDAHSYLVRTMGRFQTPAEVGETIVRGTDGAPVYLRYIAEIYDTHKEVASYAFYNGEPAVSLIVQPEQKINTLETIRRVREEVERIRPTLPLGVDVSFSTDRSVQIRDKTRQLASSALQGLALVVGILFLAMGLRNSLLVAVAIPGSLLFAFLLLQVFGMEIANITLFSFVLAIGMVVDGAIIVGENIYRHVEEGLPPAHAAKVGIREVGTAVIAADLTTVGAFLPMLMMTGIMGQYMSVLPKVMAFSLLGSILMDHFLIPVLAARFMRVRTHAEGEGEGRILALIRRAYEPVLAGALRRRWVVVGISGAAFAGALAVVGAGLIGFEFFPKVDIGRFNINYRLPIGATLDETTAFGKSLFGALADIPEVQSYVLTTGDTGALSPDGREGRERGPTVGRVTVELVPAADRERGQSEIVAELERRIGEYPGVELNFFQLREGPPVGAAVAVRLQGDDLDALSALARRIEGLLKGIPGATDVRSDLRLGKPEVRVEVDRERARTMFGVTSADVSRALFAAFQGEETTEVFLGDEKVDIRLTSAERGLDDVSALERLAVGAPGGPSVPLREIARVEVTNGIDYIRRRDQRRTVTVFADNESWITPDEILAPLRGAVEDFGVPASIDVTFAGENEERDRSTRSLARALRWGLVVILFVLAAQFNSLKQPMIVMLAIPLSFVGVILGLLATGNNFGFLSFVGTVALTGIVVNDAIVLVDYANQAVRRRGIPINEALVEACGKRLRPVLMTTITTIGGLLPLALDWSGGGDFWAPLAWSIIFGLAVATMLTLLVIPALYSLVERGGPPRVGAEAEPSSPGGEGVGAAVGA